jgi:hypothetical protein
MSAEWVTSETGAAACIGNVVAVAALAEPKARVA